MASTGARTHSTRSLASAKPERQRRAARRCASSDARAPRRGGQQREHRGERRQRRQDVRLARQRRNRAPMPTPEQHRQPQEPALLLGLEAARERREDAAGAAVARRACPEHPPVRGRPLTAAPYPPRRPMLHRAPNLPHPNSNRSQDDRQDPERRRAGRALCPFAHRLSCTSAARARPCSTGSTPRAAAASSCCASRIPTASATTRQAVDAILDGLKWLELDWDGEPSRSSRAPSATARWPRSCWRAATPTAAT